MMTSATPPAAIGMMTRIGLVGYADCAQTGDMMNANNAPAMKRVIRGEESE
jgi:hypothetical protein